MYDVSVVIVNWNGGDLLRQCLEAVQASVDCTPEVILVDNASTDGSSIAVAQQYPRLRLIKNDANVGFARANNMGIRASTSRYVMLLNNDALLAPQTLRILVSYMDGHPRVAACGARLLYADGSTQPFAYGSDPTIGHLIARGLLAARGRSIHDWNVGVSQEVDWVAGTAMLARRAACDEAGLLDESFFMYFEDVEWCRRFRDRGWRVAYVPEAAVIHLNKRTYRDQQRQRRYDRSLRRYYALHYSVLDRLLLRTLLLPYALIRLLRR